jgi:hypothetical protein
VPPAAGAETAAPGNRWAALPWRRIAVFAVVAFLVAMLAISLFEVLAGRSVGTLTGGSNDKRTSITGLFGDTTTGGSHRRTPPATTSPSSTPSAQDSTSPSTGSSATAPTSSAAPTGQPTSSDQPTGSVAPSEAPSTPASDVATVTGVPMP